MCHSREVWGRGPVHVRPGAIAGAVVLPGPCCSDRAHHEPPEIGILQSAIPSYATDKTCANQKPGHTEFAQPGTAKRRFYAHIVTAHTAGQPGLKPTTP